LIEGFAGFVAWLGASVVVLSDGRRGLALGAALSTLALALIVVADAGPVAAIAVGGVVGWGIMPPGSTPRFILCVAGGLLALWIALGVTSGHSSALRFAVITVAGLSGARVLSSDESSVLLTSVALLALAVAAASGLTEGVPSIWPYVVAAAIAAGVGWLPQSAPRAA